MRCGPFDRSIEVGGFISAPTGRGTRRHLIPIRSRSSDAAEAADSASGCGACVGGAPERRREPVHGAKIAHLNLLLQGQAERYQRRGDGRDDGGATSAVRTDHGEC